MKIIDEREMQKQNKTTTTTKKTKTKEQGCTEAIVKGWELNNFVVHLSWFSPINM